MEKWIFAARLLRAKKMSPAGSVIHSRLMKTSCWLSNDETWCWLSDHEATHSASPKLGNFFRRLQWILAMRDLNEKIARKETVINMFNILPLPSPKLFTGILDSLTADARAFNYEITEQDTDYDHHLAWHPILVHLFSNNLVRQPVDNAIVNDLAKHKRYYAIWRFYRLMISEGQIPCFQTLNNTLECFSRMHEVKHSFAILGTILKMGFTPNFVTYINLMVGLVVEEKLVEVPSLLGGMEKTGLPPYSYFYYYFRGQSVNENEILAKVKEIFAEYARKQGWNLEDL